MIKFCNLSIKNVVWGKLKLGNCIKGQVYAYIIDITCRFPVVDGIPVDINTSLWDLGLRVPPRTSSAILSTKQFSDPLPWPRGLHYILNLKPNKYNKTNVVTLEVTSTAKLEIVDPILIIGEDQPFEISSVTIKCEEI